MNGITVLSAKQINHVSKWGQQGPRCPSSTTMSNGAFRRLGDMVEGPGNSRRSGRAMEWNESRQYAQYKI